MFQSSQDARFLLLMIAIEALIELEPRSDAALAHVEELVAATKAARGLSDDERRSMLGVLSGMMRESVSRGGRRLVAERLGNRLYRDEPAPKFFASCYTLRSRLVHGGLPLPSREDIARVVGTLEVFVSDLLSGFLGDEAQLV